MDGGKVNTFNHAEATPLREDMLQTATKGYPSSSSDKYDYKDIVHMLYTLNDCMWCTNIFVRESYLKGNIKPRGICCKSRKKMYSSDDVCKELNYIEYVLEKLLENLSSLTELSDESSGVVFNGEILNKKGQSNVSDNCAAGDCTEISERLDGKEKTELGSEIRRENDKDDTALKTVNCARYSKIESIYTIPCSTKGEFGGKQAVAGSNETKSSTTISTLNEINWRDDVHTKQTKINEKIRLVNRFLDIVAKDGALVEHVKSMDESLIKRRSEMPTDLELTKGPSDGCSCGKSWNPFRVTSVDSLLFEKEKWRVEVIQKNGGDPLEHLCGIALPLQYDSFKNDTRATYYGIKRKNLLSISLQTADKSEKIFKTQFQKVFSFSMLLLSISLYFSDLVSDLILAGDYYTTGNIDYAALTLIFVFAPLIAETLSKLILKALGWDKEYGKLKWKNVFNFNDLKILKWMSSSVKYALSSMNDYRAFAPCYAELHSHRCSKGKEECCFVGPSAWEEGTDSRYIHTVFRSMLAWNERFTLQTWLAETLNESFPQLLLQLIIAVRQMIVGDYVGLTTWVCIVTSVLNISWSMHLSHFNRHYHEGGKVLNNSYRLNGRIVEFFGNCFVYGSRLTSICLVTSVLGVWAIVGALAYLTAIYFVMITCSGRKEIYKTLHRYKTTIFWPMHRLFTVPYRIGIWRMDSLDHLLFYLEIVCLSLSLPFLLPADMDRNLAWTATGSVLSFEALGIALLYIFKKFFHPYGYVCENR